MHIIFSIREQLKLHYFVQNMFASDPLLQIKPQKLILKCIAKNVFNNIYLNVSNEFLIKIDLINGH